MTIAHHITPTPDLPMIPGGGLLNQLSGLIGQAQALVSGGVGLPGLQSIGTQLAALSGSIVSAGGAAGIDTTAFSETISTLGTQLSGVTSIAGASSVVTLLTGV